MYVHEFGFPEAHNRDLHGALEARGPIDQQSEITITLMRSIIRIRIKVMRISNPGFIYGLKVSEHGTRIRGKKYEALSLPFDKEPPSTPAKPAPAHRLLHRDKKNYERGK